MNLYIDLGNSKIKLAIFGSDLKNFEPTTFRCLDATENILENAFNAIKFEHDIKKIFCCSVAVRYEEMLCLIAKKVFNIDILFVDRKMIPLQTLNTDYDLGGFDRLLLAHAAREIYKEDNYDGHIIVSLGTATTTNVVDKEGMFLGGMIMSGVGTSYEGLSARTGLPLYELENISELPPDPIVNTTKECIESAIFYQTIASVNHAFAVTEAVLKDKYNMENINFCISGGYSNVINRYVDSNIKFLPYLVLQGLFFIDNEAN